MKKLHIFNKDDNYPSLNGKDVSPLEYEECEFAYQGQNLPKLHIENTTSFQPGCIAKGTPAFPFDNRAFVLPTALFILPANVRNLKKFQYSAL